GRNIRKAALEIPRTPSKQVQCLICRHGLSCPSYGVHWRPLRTTVTVATTRDEMNNPRHGKTQDIQSEYDEHTARNIERLHFLLWAATDHSQKSYECQYHGQRSNQ